MNIMLLLHDCLLKFLLVASLAQALLIKRYDPEPTAQITKKRLENETAQNPTGKLVFCHFMMGIVAGRKSSADYDADMRQAKDLGIDAFALNIGTDEFTGTQLGYAYESAAKNGMKVFISFDFNWFKPATDAAKVGQIISTYSKHPAQLMVDGKVFASSFSGDGLDVSAVKSAAGVGVFFAPNFSPNGTPDADSIEGALNWIAWPNNGANKAPTPGARVTVLEGDVKYNSWLAGRKPYIAPISPWFSTHYGAEVSYSKNFVFPSDLLWYERWNEVLERSPPFVEIITWNDFGESHYIAPLSSQHDDDGASKWVNDMPHDGWRGLAKPFIAAYKAGSKSVDEYIEDDKIIYWYRPNPGSVDCDSTDNTMQPGNNDSGNYFNGRPNGWEDMQDSVFVVSLLKSAGSLEVTSGSNTKTFNAPAGASSFAVDMGLGKQKFALIRDSKPVLSGTSLKDITDTCACGLYNFNAFVGSLPEDKSEPLDAAGLASFTVGLSVKTCSAAPSLGQGSGSGSPAPATTNPGAGSTGVGGKPTGATGSSPPQTTPVIPTTTASVSRPSSSGSTSTPGSVPGSVTRNTTSTAASRTGSAAAPTPTASTGGSRGCNGGTNAPGLSLNLAGLCSFSCSRGYCPPGVCVCTSTGVPETAPDTFPKGCPLSRENDGYQGLCMFSCMRGYCPPAACTTDCA